MNFNLICIYLSENLLSIIFAFYYSVYTLNSLNNYIRLFLSNLEIRLIIYEYKKYSNKIYSLVSCGMLSEGRGKY